MIAASSTGTGTGRERLALLQVLRGVAALAVLVGHVQAGILSGAAFLGTSPVAWRGFPGGFGVDLFFVISGFIILTSSAGEAGRPGGRARFLRKRAVRLVPLYWLATATFLPILLAGRVPPRGDLPSALLASLLFIPHQAVVGPDGVFPVYDLGWTLDFEMFFYVVLAACLFRSVRNTSLVTTAALSALVVIGASGVARGPVASVWTAPILLEFVLGLLVALTFRSGARPPLPWCAVAVAAGLVLIALDPFGLTGKEPGAVTPNDLRRVCGWGVPAASILCGTVFAEKGRVLGPRGLLAPLRAVGDASYSLYLVHPLVLIVVLRLWRALAPLPLRRDLTDWPCLGAVLVAAALSAGLLAHRFVEVPLTRRAGRLFHGRRPVDGAIGPVPTGNAA